MYCTLTAKVVNVSNSLYNKLNQIGITWIFSITGKQQNQCGPFRKSHSYVIDVNVSDADSVDHISFGTHPLETPLKPQVA